MGSASQMDEYRENSCGTVNRAAAVTRAVARAAKRLISRHLSKGFVVEVSVLCGREEIRDSRSAH